MDINASSLIRHPRELVYRVYRDELPEIAAYIPNVKRVETMSRTEADGHVKLHNVWTGKGDIPRVAQGIIKPEMVAWDDYADWDDAASRCNFSIKIRVFTDKFSCSGSNVITAEGPNLTRVTLKGVLTVDLRDIPGVPRILASRIAPQVEAFIVSLVRPNLEQVNTALGTYLDQRKN